MKLKTWNDIEWIQYFFRFIHVLLFMSGIYISRNDPIIGTIIAAVGVQAMIDAGPLQL